MASSSLNDICYKQIKGNFYYGIFGEFQLVVDKTTGCFNATKLCNIGGKNFYHWKRLERTKQLIECCCTKSCRHDNWVDIYEIRESNNDVISKQITGQYVPDCLLPNIIEWLKSPTSTIKEGIVYIVTTSFLKPNNLYKIGYTKNFEHRLNTFNEYRHSSEPQYFVVALYSTSNARKLETTIHKKLRNYRDEGEFFQLELIKIKQAFEEEDCDEDELDELSEKLSECDVSK
ncbi:MAG: KilA-N domain-containing protein [Cetobacterium sp.]